MMFSLKTCVSLHQLKIGTGKGESFTQFSINLKEHGLPGSYKKFSSYSNSALWEDRCALTQGFYIFPVKVPAVSLGIQL